MRRVLASLLACLVGLQPAAVGAQQGSAPGTAATQAQPAPAHAVPSVESLGMSFDRIKRELRILPPSTVKSPLKLEYYVEVQGLMPALPLFRPGELTDRPRPSRRADAFGHDGPRHAAGLQVGDRPCERLAIMGIVKMLSMGGAAGPRRTAREETPGRRSKPSANASAA